MAFEEDNYTRITFRMPKNLHAKLIAEAREKSHSMNAEIVARLEESFRASDASAQAAHYLDLEEKFSTLLGSFQTEAEKFREIRERFVQDSDSQKKSPK